MAARIIVKPLVWTKQIARGGTSQWMSNWGHIITATGANRFLVLETRAEFDLRADAIAAVQAAHDAGILAAVSLADVPPASEVA